jgi:hypothetical protein
VLYVARRSDLQEEEEKEKEREKEGTNQAGGS